MGAHHEPSIPLLRHHARSAGRSSAGALSTGRVGPTDPAAERVRTAATRAHAAAGALRGAGSDRLDDALRGMAVLLRTTTEQVLAANADDLAAADRSGMSAGLVDRLRLDETRLHGIADQLDALAAVPEPERERFVRQLPDGARVFERQVPVGVVGAIFEARPNVTVDVAAQLLKARSAGVLRTGGAALRSAGALVDAVIAPALVAAGLPADAVQLLRSPDRALADSLLSQPDLVRLVVVRGSGDTTRRLAKLGAQHGVRVLAHADGGGVLYLHAAAAPARALDLVRQGLDRLGVCNRLNLLLADRAGWPALERPVLDTLAELGIAVSAPSYEHPLGHEWALDEDRQATVTVALVDGPVEAATLAGTQTSGLAATVCTEDPAAAEAFLDAYTGTGAFWNASTRLLDGFALLGVPETGINVDHVPGPRGPVTYRDLVLRQFVVRPTART